MINTLIIEDEKPAARKLQRMLAAFPELAVVATLHSVQQGLAFFENNPHPDLIFSDIVLGDGLSFDIFEKIPTKSFIIYTTAFDSYTLKAFKLNSIDYLLKPVAEEDLARAVEKYKAFLPWEAPAALDLRQMLHKDSPKISRIVAKVGYNLKVIPVEAVTCFFTENKMTYAQTAERAYATDFTMDELEASLEEGQFFRVSRQFIIRIGAIKNIHTSPHYRVELAAQPAEEITVSRERVRDFKAWLSR